MYLSADVNIANPIDLYKIKEKAEVYASFDALITDIKWISHNVSFLGSGNSFIEFDTCHYDTLWNSI